MAHARDDAHAHIPRGSADNGREVGHLSARVGSAAATMLSRMNCDSIVSPSRARYILSPPFVRRLHHSVSKHHGVQPDLATYVRPRGRTDTPARPEPIDDRRSVQKPVRSTKRARAS